MGNYGEFIHQIIRKSYSSNEIIVFLGIHHKLKNFQCISWKIEVVYVNVVEKTNFEAGKHNHKTK